MDLSELLNSGLKNPLTKHNLPVNPVVSSHPRDSQHKNRLPTFVLHKDVADHQSIPLLPSFNEGHHRIFVASEGLSQLGLFLDGRYQLRTKDPAPPFMFGLMKPSASIPSYQQIQTSHAVNTMMKGDPFQQNPGIMLPSLSLPTPQSRRPSQQGSLGMLAHNALAHPTANYPQNILEEVLESPLERTHACGRPGCEKSSTTRNAVMRHWRAHEKVRPFACTFPDCEKAFSQSSSLTIHIRNHTGERPLECDFEGCVKSFAGSSSLARHRKTHTSDDKVYQCSHSTCGEKFTKRVYLIRHRKLLHRNLDEVNADEIGAVDQRAQRDFVGASLQQRRN